MSSVAVAERPEELASRGFDEVERHFNEARREAIANFLNVAADDPVLVPYLVTCASYGLSPIMGEIWLIPQKVWVRAKDGEPGKHVDRFRPAVGRDGFLSIARRDERYRGLQGDVVCEHDTFEVEYGGDIEKDPKVLHRFASKPTVFDPESAAPDRYRGKIIGAWAKAYAHGLPPMFYFANLREHGKLEQEWEWGDRQGEKRLIWLDEAGQPTFTRTARPKMTWAGAWDYVSPMILKAAQSYVLRILFGITGLAPADEIVLDRGKLPDGGGVAAESQRAEFEWETLDAPEDVRARLQAAVEAANGVAPLSWSPAKCEMVLKGRPVEELLQQAEAIEREVDLHSQRIDPPAGAPRATVEDEPVGQAEEAEPPEAVVLLSEEEAERLRHQRADLEAALEELQPGDEGYAEQDAELREVEERLKGSPAPAAAAE